MSRGHPDYNDQDFSIAVSTMDNADLFASQRGFLRTDGRGRLLFYDDFSHGVRRWAVSNNGTADTPAVYYTAGKSFSKEGSLLFKVNALGGNASMQLVLSSNVPSKIGLEFAVNFSQYSQWFSVGVFGAIVEGQARQGVLQFDLWNNQITVYESGGYTPVFTVTNPAYFVGKWAVCKLVINVAEDMYSHAFIMGRRVDLSSYALYGSTPSIEGTIGAVFGSLGLTYGTPASVYLGYAMLTADEP